MTASGAPGGGKYDRELQAVRRSLGMAGDEAKAMSEGVLLVVVGGPRGGGFSIAATPGLLRELPSLLRYIADDIERQAPPRA